MPVVWRARALADVVRITRYIANENPIAAAPVARELLLAGDSLVNCSGLADQRPVVWLPRDRIT